MDIIDFIPTGRQNAISRAYLCKVSELTDRSARAAIQAYNESGEGIICCESGKGYYLPETKEEAERYIRYSQSYLVSLAKKDKGMRRALRHMFSDQMELPV